MSALKDGGSAFPITVHMEGHDRYSEGGMSLRDYFAAHAPVEPQAWFTPGMDTPEPTRPVGYADFAAFNGELSAWFNEQSKRRCTQWPYAWADAMLKAREQ